jgi:hypothetical protein
MDVANLVCVREAWIAHHVAAIRKVYGQNGTATIFDGRSPVAVNVLVANRAEIPTLIALLEEAAETRVDG